jgi:hypothetical protein
LFPIQVNFLAPSVHREVLEKEKGNMRRLIALVLVAVALGVVLEDSPPPAQKATYLSKKYWEAPPKPSTLNENTLQSAGQHGIVIIFWYPAATDEEVRQEQAKLAGALRYEVENRKDPNCNPVWIPFGQTSLSLPHGYKKEWIPKSCERNKFVVQVFEGHSEDIPVDNAQIEVINANVEMLPIEDLTRSIGSTEVSSYFADFDTIYPQTPPSREAMTSSHYWLVVVGALIAAAVVLLGMVKQAVVASSDWLHHHRPGRPGAGLTH